MPRDKDSGKARGTVNNPLIPPAGKAVDRTDRSGGSPFPPFSRLHNREGFFAVPQAQPQEWNPLEII